MQKISLKNMCVGEEVYAFYPCKSLLPANQQIMLNLHTGALTLVDWEHHEMSQQCICIPHDSIPLSNKILSTGSIDIQNYQIPTMARSHMILQYLSSCLAPWGLKCERASDTLYVLQRLPIVHVQNILANLEVQV